MAVRLIALKCLKRVEEELKIPAHILGLTYRWYYFGTGVLGIFVAERSYSL